ncbi:MAG: hypothetical protein DRJ51_07895 [Thermoprotei archaeon]|nr:MAG: hypothetical protein DRJ51_07895 [Thermoprotei archaeon]
MRTIIRGQFLGNDRMRPLNFIIIGIDTLRADHLSCYGYVRKTSPNIDKLAKESVVFTNAFANGIPTHPAWTTILTGAHPLRHRIVTHMGEVQLSTSVFMIQEVLKERGYVTAAVDNMFLKYGAFYKWFTRGFFIYSHPGGVPAPEAGLKVQAEDVTKMTLEVLREVSEKNKPFFLFIHYWDPHSPYKPPPPFNRSFWKMEPPEDTSMLDYAISQYDGEIAYVDSKVGDLIEYLENSGLLDKTVIILTSDHGESLMQHDNYMGHKGLYDSITKVPLIIRFPEGEPRGTITELIQHIDIAPTIYDLAGVDPPKTVDGRSLMNVIEGGKGVEEVLMVENTQQKAMGLRTRNWKFIIYLEKTPEGLPAGYVRLYDFSKDEGEQINLAPHEVEVVESLKKRLDELTNRILEGRTNPLLEQAATMRKIKFYSEAKTLIELYGLILRERKAEAEGEKEGEEVAE